MKWIFIALGIVVVVAGLFFAHTAWIAGEFKTLEPHSAGSCDTVSIAAGPEDITIHPQTGIAFLSCDDRRAANAGNPVDGAVYAYDLGSPEPRPARLSHDLGGEFHPHGISLYSQEGLTRLFVINHRSDGHAVELFDFRDGRLYHQRTVEGQLLISPNDLLAVAPERFYVTNDHGSKTALGVTLESYLRLPKGSVVYFDGNRFTVAARRIRYANGIARNGDGSTIFVASTTGFRINVYKRDGRTGALAFDHDLELRTGVDNLEVDSLGRLWIGCHPKLLTFTRHGGDPSVLSPSQILRITNPERDTATVEEVFLDSGQMLSGSSVAAVYDGQMLVGAVFEERFLHCRF